MGQRALAVLSEDLNSILRIIICAAHNHLQPQDLMSLTSDLQGHLYTYTIKGNKSKIKKRKNTKEEICSIRRAK